MINMSWRWDNVGPATLVVKDVTDSLYSVLPIYRGHVYRGIGYIAVACWTHFLAPKNTIFLAKMAVTPWTQFVGDNFSLNLLTAIAFVLGPQDTIFRETNSSLPVIVSMRAGTHVVRWCATLGEALTPPLCRRVGSSQSNSFNQILAVWPRCLHLPSCPDTGTVPQRIKSAWLVDIPRFL